MYPMNKVVQTHIAPPLVTGLAYSFVTMGLGTLIASFILMLTNQKEDSLPMIAYLIHAISLLFGSYVTGKRSKSKGWYHGGILGILYALIIFIVAFLSFDHGINMQSLQFLAVALGSGVLGGIFGVNAAK